MDSHYASFLNRNRAELIQRVNSVMPVADVLMSKMLGSEIYLEIKEERTSQAKMRRLLMALNSSFHIDAFYHALKEFEPHLVEELENGPRTEGLAEASRGTQETSSDARHGKDSMVVETALQQQWHKTSKRWKTLLQDLLNEPSLQSVGNGNLFFSTETKYEIGHGCNGTTVYLGMKADGSEVAIKRMLKSMAIKDGKKNLQHEMSLLRDLDLENCHIVKYVDFVEEGEFYYLVLQLCEFHLDGYMEHLRQNKEEDKEKALKKVAKEVLLGLQVLHVADVLHRDIKPRNVLIDVKEKARLSDFGLSRRLNPGASARTTERAGTAGWEAAEILNDENVTEGKVKYKKSSDMQVAGMLVHYILSDGHHPFGEDDVVEQNIKNGKATLHSNFEEDVEATDLIQEMIQKDPKKRLTIGEAIDHPYFWDDARRDAFLRKVGDEKAVQNWKNPDQTLRKAVDNHTTKEISEWKSKIIDAQKKHPQMKELDYRFPDNLHGLLRYIRNSLVHADNFVGFEVFKRLFPDFFICAQKLAKEMDWKA